MLKSFLGFFLSILPLILTLPTSDKRFSVNHTNKSIIRVISVINYIKLYLLPHSIYLSTMLSTVVDMLISLLINVDNFPLVKF